MWAVDRINEIIQSLSIIITWHYFLLLVMNEEIFFLFTYYLCIWMSFSSVSATLSFFFWPRLFLSVSMSSLLLILLCLPFFYLTWHSARKLAMRSVGRTTSVTIALRYGDDNSTWFTPSLQINFHNCARVFFSFLFLTSVASLNS